MPGIQRIMAVIKANAYGHGAVPVARTLLAEGVQRFGVALPEEGVELRQAGITAPIHVLGEALSTQYQLIIDYDLTPTVGQDGDTGSPEQSGQGPGDSEKNPCKD